MKKKLVTALLVLAFAFAVLFGSGSAAVSEQASFSAGQVLIVADGGTPPPGSG